MLAVSRILCLLISIFCSGFIFYEYISFGQKSFLSHLLIKPFFVASTLAILIPTKFKIRYINKYFTSLIIWLVTILFSFLIITVHYKSRNYSTDIISVEYQWEDGININFRENKTFRVENSHLLGGEVNYGKFKLKDSVIILLDKIKFGGSYMKDTLTVGKDGVSFTLENPWSGLKEATMIYEYSSKTKFPITNHTNNHIDSITIKMSYSNKITNYQSLNPGQTDEYKFDLKNPYVNGKYILTFNDKKSRINYKEFRKFTNGYPLEAVKKINIHNDKIITELIFGTLITTELNN